LQNLTTTEKGIIGRSLRIYKTDDLNTPLACCVVGLSEKPQPTSYAPNPYSSYGSYGGYGGYGGANSPYSSYGGWGGSSYGARSGPTSGSSWATPKASTKAAASQSAQDNSYGSFS